MSGQKEIGASGSSTAMEKNYSKTEWSEQEKKRLEEALEQMKAKTTGDGLHSKLEQGVKEFVSKLRKTEGASKKRAIVPTDVSSLEESSTKRLRGDDDEMMPLAGKYYLQIKSIPTSRNQSRNLPVEKLHSLIKSIPTSRNLSRNLPVEKLPQLVEVLRRFSTLTETGSGIVIMERLLESNTARGDESGSQADSSTDDEEQESFLPVASSSFLAPATPSGEISRVLVGGNENVALPRHIYLDSLTRSSEPTHFAVRLAELVFGNDTLQGINRDGRNPGTQQLDPTIIEAIQTEVTERFLPRSPPGAAGCNMEKMRQEHCFEMQVSQIRQKTNMTEHAWFSGVSESLASRSIIALVKKSFKGLFTISKLWQSVCFHTLYCHQYNCLTVRVPNCMFLLRHWLMLFNRPCVMPQMH
ncbi:hypothetical protein OS493_030874 [Desmophyllum pertusum]|uniref:BEN domain-containing protein n=1 Tax=Desmophyllum pertusum TaxID=174260 RepID=A0A9X0CEU8_9CNID|nr:hypothetical protein OS493_030874 [Desmophyllum pertusum]